MTSPIQDSDVLPTYSETDTITINDSNSDNSHDINDSNGLPPYSDTITIDDSNGLQAQDIILPSLYCDDLPHPPPYSSGCIAEQPTQNPQMENTQMENTQIPKKICCNNNCFQFCKSASYRCCICGKETIECLGNLVIGIIVCPFVCCYNCITEPDPIYDSRSYITERNRPPFLR